jgi:FAD/FMN-containing dehydrogenase
MTELHARLAAIVGAANLLTTPHELAPAVTDMRGRYTGQPLAMALPASREEVAALVALCAAEGIAIVPQGGNTSTCGAATPDASGRQLIIGLRRMQRVRSIDAANLSITVDAGCTLAQVQQAAASVGRLFPLSLASEGSCQIGGNLSTNAGGLAVLRYGTMRELTLGLEVVLPDGTLLDALAALRKDTTGLDVKQLFIGAEGQLGLITGATLKLFALPTAYSTALLAVDSADAAIAALNALQTRFGDRLTTFEMMSDLCLRISDKHKPGCVPFFAPWVLLVELSDGGEPAALQASFEHWLASQTFSDGVLAQSEAERARLWQLREAISDMQKREGPSIKHDIGVPSSAIPAFLASCGAALEAAFPGVRIVAFGHAGDGNLHYNISNTRPGNAELFADEDAVNAIVYEHVYRYRGTLAAEHGIGQLKAHWLARYKDPAALAIMRGVKQLLDPQGIMNPGRWL